MRRGWDGPTIRVEVVDMLVQVRVTRLWTCISELAHQDSRVTHRMRRMTDRSRKIGVYFLRMDRRVRTTLIARCLCFGVWGSSSCSRPHVRDTDSQCGSHESGRKSRAVSSHSQSAPCQCRLCQRTEQVTQSGMRHRSRGCSGLCFDLHSIRGLMCRLLGLIPIVGRVRAREE